MFAFVVVTGWEWDSSAEYFFSWFRILVRVVYEIVKPKRRRVAFKIDWVAWSLRARASARFLLMCYFAQQKLQEHHWSMHSVSFLYCVYLYSGVLIDCVAFYCMWMWMWMWMPVNYKSFVKKCKCVNVWMCECECLWMRGCKCVFFLFSLLIHKWLKVSSYLYSIVCLF